MHLYSQYISKVKFFCKYLHSKTLQEFCFYDFKIILRVDERTGWKLKKKKKSYIFHERKLMPVWTRTQFEAILGLNLKLTMILQCLVWDFANPLLENSATRLEVFNSARAIVA